MNFDISSPLVVEATSSFPTTGLVHSKGFLKIMPFFLSEPERPVPRSIFSVLRDAFYSGRNGKIKELHNKRISVIDPEYLSEDPALYQKAQLMAKTAEHMYDIPEYTFKTDGDFLYVINRGTNLPLMIYVA